MQPIWVYHCWRMLCTKEDQTNGWLFSRSILDLITTHHSVWWLPRVGTTFPLLVEVGFLFASLLKNPISVWRHQLAVYELLLGLVYDLPFSGSKICIFSFQKIHTRFYMQKSLKKCCFQKISPHYFSKSSKISAAVGKIQKYSMHSSKIK